MSVNAHRGSRHALADTACTDIGVDSDDRLTLLERYSFVSVTLELVRLHMTFSHECVPYSGGHYVKCRGCGRRAGEGGYSPCGTHARSDKLGPVA